MQAQRCAAHTLKSCSGALRWAPHATWSAIEHWILLMEAHRKADSDSEAILSASLMSLHEEISFAARTYSAAAGHPHVLEQRTHGSSLHGHSHSRGSRRHRHHEHTGTEHRHHHHHRHRSRSRDRERSGDDGNRHHRKHRQGEAPAKHERSMVKSNNDIKETTREALESALGAEPSHSTHSSVPVMAPGPPSSAATGAPNIINAMVTRMRRASSIVSGTASTSLTDVRMASHGRSRSLIVTNTQRPVPVAATNHESDTNHQPLMSFSRTRSLSMGASGLGVGFITRLRRASGAQTATINAQSQLPATTLAPAARPTRGRGGSDMWQDKWEMMGKNGSTPDASMALQSFEQMLRASETQANTPTSLPEPMRTEPPYSGGGHDALQGAVDHLAPGNSDCHVHAVSSPTGRDNIDHKSATPAAASRPRSHPPAGGREGQAPSAGRAHAHSRHRDRDRDRERLREAYSTPGDGRASGVAAERNPPRRSHTRKVHGREVAA